MLIGGASACENSFLLTDMLKEKMGFKVAEISEKWAMTNFDRVLADADQERDEIPEDKEAEAEETIAAPRTPSPVPAS